MSFHSASVISVAFRPMPVNTSGRRSVKDAFHLATAKGKHMRPQLDSNDTGGLPY